MKVYRQSFRVFFFISIQFLTIFKMRTNEPKYRTDTYENPFFGLRRLKEYACQFSCKRAVLYSERSDYISLSLYLSFPPARAWERSILALAVSQTRIASAANVPEGAAIDEHLLSPT